MATKDFDYKTFAKNLAQQAQELVPQEFDDNQKQYVINTLGNFSLLAGQTLAEDTNLNFNAEQSILITQIIAEWSFHKSVDLIRSGIPQQYWDSVMQKIAYTIFEIAKQAMSQSLPQEQMLEAIEHHVKKTYVEAIEELKNKGIIDDALMEFAASQSNMDKMVQEVQQEQEQTQSQEQAQTQEQGEPQQSSQLPAQAQQGVAPVANQTGAKPVLQNGKIASKSLKLATVAMVFNRMKQDKVQTILNKFEPNDARDVIKYMQVDDLEGKVGAQNAMQCLHEMQSVIPKITEASPTVTLLKLQKFASKYNKTQIENILLKERIGVKKLVFNAIEGEYYDKIPPIVSSIIAQHLLDSV